MSGPNEDDRPVTVEFTDGSMGTLPSVAEFQRRGAETDRQYEEFRQTPFMQALLSFDYDNEP